MILQIMLYVISALGKQNDEMDEHWNELMNGFFTLT